MSKRTLIILCCVFAAILLLAVLLPILTGQDVQDTPKPTDPKPTAAPTDPMPSEDPTKPSEDPTEPSEPTPTQTEPVETEPVETEPVETEPVETEPVETEPVETKPVETEPVETKPVETEPAPTNPEEDDKEAQAGSWDDVMLNNEIKASNTYYVSSTGSDMYPGTEAKPFKTINHALDVVKSMISQVDGTITVHVEGGKYQLSDTLYFDENSFADPDKSVVFQADGDVLVSGGKNVSGWEKVTVNGIEMYKAKVLGVDHIRQFYVNDTAQPRAALAGEYTWRFKSANDKSAVVIDGVDLSNIHDASALELRWKVEWKLFIHLASSVYGDTINMQQPYFKFTTSAADSGRDPNGYYFPNPNRHVVTLSNDLSFINTPGEWYFDQNTHELYYYPAAGVNLSEAACTVPVLEELISINGALNEKVQNITFDGFTFKHAAMNHISKHGLAINQYHTYSSGITTTTSGGYSSPYSQLNGNINLVNTNNVSFLNCEFHHMGGAALNISKGAHHTTVEGCVFTDLSDAAIVIGHSENSAAKEKQKTMYTVISNNVIRRVGQDYTAMPAIAGYYAAHTQIVHNDIADVPYSAITLGWGWGHDYYNNGSHNNTISFNRIDGYLQDARDGGGIYTLGAQPDSEIEGNYISNQGNPFGGIYLDEGSAYFTVKNNVVDNNQMPGNHELRWLHVNGRDIWNNGKLSCYELTLKDNYTSNSREGISWQDDNCSVTGTVLVEDGNWPAEAQTIMSEAGLTEEYKGLLDKAE